MEDEKSFVYTLILGTCILLCLLLVGKMTLQHLDNRAEEPQSPMTEVTEEPPTETEEIRLTEQDLTAMLRQALPESFPVQNLSVSLWESDTVQLDGIAEKEQLQNSFAGSSIYTLLRFLPERFPVQVVFELTGQGKDLQLQPTILKINTTSFPVEFLPQEALAAMNTAMRTVLENSGFLDLQISIQDGAVVLRH